MAALVLNAVKYSGICMCCNLINNQQICTISKTEKFTYLSGMSLLSISFLLAKSHAV